MLVFPALLAGALLVVWAGDAGVGKGEAVHTAYHLAATAGAGLGPDLEEGEHADWLMRLRPAGRTAGLRSLAGGCRLVERPGGGIDRGAVLVGIADTEGRMWSKFVRRGGRIQTLPDKRHRPGGAAPASGPVDFDWDAEVAGVWASVQCRAEAGPFASEVSAFVMVPVPPAPPEEDEVESGGEGTGDGDGVGDVVGHGEGVAAAVRSGGVWVSWPAPDDGDGDGVADEGSGGGGGGFGDGEGNRVVYQAQKCAPVYDGSVCWPWRTVQPSRSPGRLGVLFDDLPGGGRFVFGLRAGAGGGYGTDTRTTGEVRMPGKAAVLGGRAGTGPVVTAPGMPDGPVWVAYWLYKRLPDGTFGRVGGYGGTGVMDLPAALPAVTGDCAGAGQVCYLEAVVDQDSSGNYYYGNSGVLEWTRMYFTGGGPFAAQEPPR